MNATDVLNKRNRDTKASTYRDIDAGHWTNIDYMTVFIQKSNGSGGGREGGNEEVLVSCDRSHLVASFPVLKSRNPAVAVNWSRAQK